ncbi:Eco57I restriction-modification methylase domain-containing protein [Brachyspira hyodysenteriae]|uniref:Eco57I restriction-modification methylase domain-containing protein n=1 Tax=Brachyspira hyodysenteriae TaxID=159 RepID=UPI0022CD836B|nr:N-6 DNA methylase [Brachyspira hyodysenteriae]MCZ9851231.1 N-6 DNA methylase [Brachyspira hyodysenteriae]MCZ9860043.1 N-6 DNA methylase [Brachyspira hyodysenteriae]MCZ9895279.1 N-6 DNA methylase [Brachyspira hyodysenteriae]MCZ9916516.1 N-6 DNA methylase [Brachyspira hyodysenteriae]MCZ9922586.1 N-6 DNA methylase [Brachyspira hyodysenteriae]
MYSKEEVYKKVEELVIKFRNNKDQYTNKNYNETETRRDFLDPFFEAFGWDVSNRAGKSQTYRDVIHEDKVKVGKETKAPDYAFRIGGNRVFFVEAKKPGVNLKEDNLPAFQLRRYGWSAKLGISFLTDFEELAVYDCTRKPNVNDKASTARIEYIHFEDYLNRFDFLYEILNKERIEQGSLEKYIAGTSNKKGTESVDIDFLNSLDSLRTKLASNIAKLNKNLSVRDLNYAVQQIIDRIIFLRAAEDRGIEEYGDLKKTCENKGDNFYSNLLKIFEKADGRYNSGLFDFSKDSISSSIEIDNRVIKEIINELYYPLSPYEFSVISVEIIGNAYEQFLGKTITIGKNHSAKIELKPEVRKAGGVYYTPEYIVDYIVANTVGEAIKGKKPEEIANIKILDPACGSGSFLLGAYKYLLNYHIEYYNKIKDRAKFKGSKEDVIKENGDLTIWIKKQILRNNIFGVDIDSNAVEVTKLSLLMKCLEGESPASIQNNQDLFNERALPSLEDNIKCGNSLIGNDFYESHLDLDDDTLYKINCFDWNSKFRDIMKAGGFDVVIGNPPYVQIQGMEKELKEGYKEANYKNYISTGDIYQLFFEKGLDVLKVGGIVGMITSNKWMRAGYGAVTRDYFYRNANVNGVVDLGGGRFKGATVDTSIMLYSKNDGEIKINEPREFKAIKFYDDLINLKDLEFKNDIVIANHDKEWIIMNNIENDIFEKINKHKLLKDLDIKINSGIKTGFNEAFFIDEETKNNLIKEDAKSAELIKPLLKGRDMRRYYCIHNNLYLINTHNGIKEKNVLPINIKDYPAIKKHLDKFYKQLEKRGDKGVTPYNLRNCAYLDYFDKPKIMFNKASKINAFYLDNEGKYYGDVTTYILSSNNLEYLLAILNSNMFYYAYNKYYVGGGIEGELTLFTLENFPIPEPDKETESKLVNLVDNIIDLNKKLSAEKNPNTIEMLNTRIQAVDKAIDKIVYALYGLNDEEIKIIEGE